MNPRYLIFLLILVSIGFLGLNFISAGTVSGKIDNVDLEFDDEGLFVSVTVSSHEKSIPSISDLSVKLLDEKFKTVEKVSKKVILRADGHTETILIPIEVAPEKRYLYSVDVEFAGETAHKRLIRPVERQDVLLLGQDKLEAGGNASFRIVVRNAATNKPVEDAQVEFKIKNKENDGTLDTPKYRTNEHGTVDASFVIPEYLSGECHVVATVKSEIGEEKIERDINVITKNQIYLTSDKPVYQPGQLMHLRALVLRSADWKPVAERPMTLEIADGKGNKVFKKSVETSEYGIVSAEFQLADEVNEGAYTITGILGDQIAEKVVTVKRYVLPKFKVEIETDRDYYMPGDEITGTIESRYFFGKPVAEGKVKVKASCFDVGFHEFDTFEGKTDDDGKCPFKLAVPEKLVAQESFKGTAMVQLEVKVKDGADHEEEKYHIVHVAQHPIQMDVVPESGTVIAGVENSFYLLASYPDGSAATPELSVSLRYDEDKRPRKKLSAKTDDKGLATVDFDISKDVSRVVLDILAKDTQGNKAETTHALETEKTGYPLLLRVDRGTYQVGDTMQVEIISPDRPRETVFVDIIKNGQTILTKSVDLENGKATVPIDLDQHLFGTLTLHGYQVLPNGEMAGDTRKVVVNRRDDLQIAMTPDREEYRPGDPAEVDIRVTNSEGEGTAAALGIDVVDESVFSVVEKTPGLAKVFFTIEKELLDPKYEIHGFSFEEITRASARDREWFEKAAKVSLARSAEKPSYSLRAFTGDEILQQARQQVVYLARQLLGIDEESRTPGSVEEILYPRIQLVDARAVVDPWGLDYRVAKKEEYQVVRSAGPDHEFDTSDDIEAPIVPQHPQYRSRGRGELWFGRAAQRRRFGGELKRGVGMAGAPVEQAFALNGAPAFGRVAQEELERGGRVVKMLPMAAPAAGGVMLGDRLGAGIDKQGMVAGGMGFGMAKAPDDGLVRVQASISLNDDPNRINLGDQPVNYYFDKGAGVDELEPGELDRMALYARREEAQKKAELAGEPSETPAAKREKPADIRVRSYFPEMLYTNPSVITDENGHGLITLAMADSITTWRMTALANSKQGELGSGEGSMRVFQEFFIDLDLPIALTKEDEVSIPVAIHNYLPRPQTVQVEIERSEWFDLLEDETRKTVEIAANDVGKVDYRIRANELGKNKITVFGWSEEKEDAVARVVEVRPNGEEQFITHNGRLIDVASHALEFPENAIPDASTILLRIYPGIFSQVVEGLDSIMRMPHGCFEQTSSITYPNLLVLDYMKRTDQITPEIQMKAREYINLGYQRLLTFEIDTGGFEVFGNPPANRVLSAYGLLEFTDMNEVYPIDERVIERTQRWVVSEQQADGSWLADKNYAHGEMWKNIQNNPLLVTAFVTWGLGHSGYRGEALDKARAYLKEHIDECKESYTMAMVANAWAAHDPKDPALVDLLERLKAQAVETRDTIKWPSEVSLSFAHGEVATIETTALVSIAMTKSGRYPNEVGKALNYLIQQKDPNGTWHSTHATVLALKAMVEALGNATEEMTGTVTVKLDGKAVGELEITPENCDVVRLLSLGRVDAPGKHEVELQLDGDGSIMYQVVGSYFTPWSDKKRREPLSIAVDYDRTELQKDDTVTARVTARNNAGRRAEMVILDVGIPPGFRVESDPLEDAVKAEKIAKYTLTGRQVTIYLRALDSDEEFSLEIPMKARLVITAKTPESKVYEYYNPEVNGYDDPEELKVN